jgi:hypothetical protein
MKRVTEGVNMPGYFRSLPGSKFEEAKRKARKGGFSISARVQRENGGSSSKSHCRTSGPVLCCAAPLCSRQRCRWVRCGGVKWRERGEREEEGVWHSLALSPSCLLASLPRSVEREERECVCAQLLLLPAWPGRVECWC